MGKPVSRPPVVGPTAAQVRNWANELVTHAGKLLTEEDTDDREIALARCSAAQFLIGHLGEYLDTKLVPAAQELNASNEQLSFALGLRPSTTHEKYPPLRRRAQRRST